MHVPPLKRWVRCDTFHKIKIQTLILSQRQTNLPRAKRRGDRNIQLPEMVSQQPEHPGRPAVALGDERNVLELRLYAWRVM